MSWATPRNNGNRLGTHASSVLGFILGTLAKTQHAGSVRTQAVSRGAIYAR
jgi:hypothetical protein